MGNSIEAPLYHSTWNGMIQRITNGVTPTYLYCAFSFSVNLSYCCLQLLLYMLSIFSVILFSCRHYGIVGREALCCLCLINHFVVVVVVNTKVVNTLSVVKQWRSRGQSTKHTQESYIHNTINGDSIKILPVVNIRIQQSC